MQTGKNRKCSVINIISAIHDLVFNILGLNISFLKLFLKQLLKSICIKLLTKKR